MFKNLKLGIKIGLGYGMIGLVLAGAVLATIWQIDRTENAVDRMIDLRSPTVRSCFILQIGLNQSLSALRGWIILGDDAFRGQRAEAWSKQIEPSVSMLKTLLPEWRDKDHATQLKEIETLLEDLKKYQSEIEDIAQTVENTPAQKILIEEGVPLADILYNDMSRIIEIEQTLEASAERKNLLGMMSDIRGSLGISLASIRAYLISGNQKFKEDFEVSWATNGKRLSDLTDSIRLLTPEQQKFLKDFNAVREKFNPLPAKVFAIRGGNEWNLARAWLTERAVPVSQQINEHINIMLENQEKLMEQEQTELKRQTAVLKYGEITLLLAGLFLCAFAAIFITRIIIKPLQEAVNAANRLAQGDLTVIFETETKDETGQLIAAMKKMVENIRRIIKELIDATNSLSSSSEELASVSTEMSASAEDMNIRADRVATSSEEINSSVSGVASAAEQSSASVSSIAAMTEEMSSAFAEIAEFTRKTSENVKNMAKASDEISFGIHITASSTEEMTTSLNEVAKHTGQANRISRNADRSTEDINIKMNALASASGQIGKIIGMIKDIADQTNMLALNATIEAAGAGEAGKGFAVVAAEVKLLAKQSAEAADEISDQIEQIQKSTGEAVVAVGELSKIINEIAKINESISISVEEQTAAANEISKSASGNAKAVKEAAQNANESSKLVEEIAKKTDEISATAKETAVHVDELAKGIKDVAMSANEAARAVRDISENIQSISTASKETAAGTTQTSASSEELAKMASALLEIVERFKL
ncbi:MAG: hypothetical protein BWK80_01255 [Desulfobacteraceae bacterium IS3]|nr:MAG: hypothetical protein BWK80_01255 [Desulfobacteraceae bacterium IS3]